LTFPNVLNTAHQAFFTKEANEYCETTPQISLIIGKKGDRPNIVNAQ
jgi:hypothetical protein